jgi:UV DNA damage repair endonuclease
MSNRYDKMEEYITSIFNIFHMLNRKAEQKQDNRFMMIVLTIYNYAKYMANEYKIELKYINKPESINLIPVFEYIEANNIKLYDFSNINLTDVDITKKEDLERFVISHVYYITQGTK